MRVSSLLVPMLLAVGSVQAQEAPKLPASTAMCSHDLEPAMLLWTKTFQATSPAFKLEVRPGVSGEAAKALIEGRALYAPVTRELKPEELNAFKQKWGYLPVRLAVGMESLEILVHKDNPIKEIKIEQVDAIWTVTRTGGWPKDIQTWGDLGLTTGNWAALPIVCMDRPEGSDLAEFFDRMITRGGKDKVTHRRCADAKTLSEAITSTPAAIGYGAMGEAFTGLRAIPVVRRGEALGVEPTQANVANATYPLIRLLFIYVNQPADQPMQPMVKDFLRYVLSPAGQKQLETVGLSPLHQDVLALNLKKLGG